MKVRRYVEKERDGALGLVWGAISVAHPCIRAWKGRIISYPNPCTQRPGKKCLHSEIGINKRKHALDKESDQENNQFIG